MQSVLYIVDDDEGVRRSLQRSLSPLDLQIEVYGAGQEFLDRVSWGRAGCLILDVVMPGLSGLDVLRRIPSRDPLEVIMLTGYGAVGDAVASMKLGAFDYMEKPIHHDTLLEKIEDALQSSRMAQEQWREASEVRSRFATLTQAERTVVEHLQEGRTTEEIAAILHRSQRTVGNHRQRILEKMKVRSTTELVRALSALR